MIIFEQLLTTYDNFWSEEYLLGIYGSSKNLTKLSGVTVIRVNFIIILRTAFTREDPKRAKRSWQNNWIFTLLESVRIKAACKHVGEIDPPAYFTKFHKISKKMVDC